MGLASLAKLHTIMKKNLHFAAIETNMKIYDLVHFITLHIYARAGGNVIGAGVHLYVYDPKKNLNDTLAVDSPFQTLAVDISSNIYRLALPLCTPETLSSLSKSRITLINVHHAIFVRRMSLAHFLYLKSL